MAKNESVTEWIRLAIYPLTYRRICLYL